MKALIDPACKTVQHCEMLNKFLTQAIFDDFARDGVVLIKSLFAEFVETLRAGIDFNMANPGPFASEYVHKQEKRRFFDDYCNWERIPEFEKVISTSEVTAVAANLMQSRTVQLFHDHVLVKKPGTSKPTPWHTDGPYYFVEGSQTVSFWPPLDPVTQASLPECRGRISGAYQFYLLVGWLIHLFILMKRHSCRSPIQTWTA